MPPTSASNSNPRKVRLSITAPETPPPDLAAALARAGDRLGRVGRPIYYFSDPPSTNDIAARLADQGATEGTTVVAAAQSAGRGRQGRSWFSPPGAGLYVSIVCRQSEAAPLLTLAAGVAVAEGITAATALPVTLKWPNDVVIEANGVRRRKLAGILAEASSAGGRLQYVVVGIGINVRTAAYPPPLASYATSIEAELGRRPDTGAVLVELLIAFDRAIDLLVGGHRDVLLERWRALAPSARGAAIEWDSSDGTVSGTSAGIADDGALLIRTDRGVERIISGEVRWR